MKIFAVFSLIFAVSMAAPIVKDKPSFCDGLDCPKYTLIAVKKGYEIRKYEATKWVGTTIASMSFTTALHIAYGKIAAYISGANSASEKIPMATPIATKIVPGQGPACDSNFTVLLFIPFTYQSRAPAPTDPQVALVDLPPITAYVTSFGGWEADNELQQEASELANTLIDDNIDYVTDFYLTASYDPPTKDTGRHSEVWFLAA